MSYVLQVTRSSDGVAVGTYLAGCEDRRVDLVYELDRAHRFTTQHEAQDFIDAHPPLRTYTWFMWSDR